MKPTILSLATLFLEVTNSLLFENMSARYPNLNNQNLSFLQVKVVLHEKAISSVSNSLIQLAFIKPITGQLRNEGLYAYLPFYHTNTKKMYPQGSVFHKMSKFYCFTKDIKWNWSVFWLFFSECMLVKNTIITNSIYYHYLDSWQGASSLTHHYYAPLVKMSVKWK